MAPLAVMLTRLVACWTLGCAAYLPCSGSASDVRPVASEEEACAVLKRAAVEFHLSTHDLTGRYYCESLRDVKTHYVLGLRYHFRPNEQVGSNLIGWFAVAKSDGAVFDWDINEERVMPLTPRPPFKETPSGAT